MSLLEGKSRQEGMEEVKAKFWTVYMVLLLFSDIFTSENIVHFI
jgi:hypothetical protein